MRAQDESAAPSTPSTDDLLTEAHAAIDHYREGLYRILRGEDDPRSVAASYLGEDATGPQEQGTLAQVLQQRNSACAEAQRLKYAIAWLEGCDKGISSVAICLHMLGLPPSAKWGPQSPCGSDDVGRCVRLLRQPFAVGWLDRLDEMGERYGILWKSAVADIRHAIQKQSDASAHVPR